MGQAIELAQSTDVTPGGNPRVGCVIVDSSGEVVGRGHHRGAGTPHAEVVALLDAGARARGATAVVTLEPCRHTGRTGPCVEALVAAGVRRVVYGVADPGEESGGGAVVLAAAGVEVVPGVEEDEARWVARAWLHARELGRPLVTLKSAVSLDGRVAGPGGGPTAITGPPARAWAHEWRSRVDAIVVGTGTVLADDPSLTARTPTGDLHPRQPMRVVVGRRPIPADANVLDDAAETVVFSGHDLVDLLRVLAARDVQHVLVEGGPTLEAAFLEAGLADEVLWFVAPLILGDGPVAIPALGTMVDVTVRRTLVMGEDVVVEGVLGVHRNR
jgi:diaminohydroxyphosphoribosylaminopyrimidine deaminase/5-amino-6-(5-phosphoribosylamino)uracil reductase